MGELGVSSLREVYKMSWREFQLRLHAYKRQKKQDLIVARQMTYYSGYGVQVPKAVSIDKFWQIDKESKELSESQKESMKKALENARAKQKK